MPSSAASSNLTRVLLVDDSEIMLTCARAALTHDCTVVGAVKDGLQALEAARRLHPDVIVLDISMPGMTGLEVASRLRAEGSTAAVVFLTVHDDEDFVLAAKKAGGIGYVVKLRLAADLLHAVEEARAGRSFVSPFSRATAPVAQAAH
ncbi:MAG TPA: response regulator transcription factor [Vicinamibacterales bacterium]|nr:response regulator transcription factor [Vicinamibacterales bacterium]